MHSRQRSLKSRGERADKKVDKWQSAICSQEGRQMSVGPISAASLSQYVLASSNSTQLQQTLQTLQNSLALGDLTGAQSAFHSLQRLNQNLTTASGSSASNGSPLSTDLAALGSALTSGDLATAQSAFTTVKGDLKSATSSSQTLETSLASQSEKLVQGLLSSLNPSETSSSASDPTTALLDSVYGVSGGLNVTA